MLSISSRFRDTYACCRSNFLARCDLPVNRRVNEVAECCQRFQLRIITTLISIIIEAWEDGEKHDSCLMSRNTLKWLPGATVSILEHLSVF